MTTQASDDQQPEREAPAAALPAWIAPILRRERALADERIGRLRSDREQLQFTVNRSLIELGIIALRPAQWAPNGLIKAVLLEPGQAGDHVFGVRAGWHEDHVALYAYDPGTGDEHYVGPLESVEAAADARRGPVAAAPAPVDHEAEAEQHLRSAAAARTDALDPDEKAALDLMAAQARAVLALNATLSRRNVYAALAAALAARPAPAAQDAAAAAREGRLLEAIFPERAAAPAGEAPGSAAREPGAAAAHDAGTPSGHYVP
jgi:hypothetical protein